MYIAIWGAGKFGQYVFSQLEKNNELKVICFIDNNAGEKSNQFRGGVCDIISPDVYSRKYAKKVDVVLVAFLDGITILDQLRTLGISCFGIIHQRVYRYRLPLHQVLKEDTNIIWNDDPVILGACLDTLETNVVDYCNMNCKGCSHFSNLFPKGSEIPFEIFERDIKQLAKKIFVSQFNLLGGEVLLSDKLTKYILCLKKYMPKTKVELVSNGVLIPRQQKETLECIRDNEVTVSITEYPPVITLLEKIKDTLEQYHILYQIRPLVKTFGKNIDLSGKNDPRNAMLACRESKCQFLRNGRIYKCPFSAFGNYFLSYYNIPFRFDVEGTDIFDMNLNWKHLTTQIRSNPIKMCKYCGNEQQFAWEISNNPDKTEWLVSE